MTLQLKLIALLVALAALAGGCIYIYEKGNTHGTMTERAVWVIKVKQRTDAELEAIAKNTENNALLRKAHDLANLKDTQAHELALSKVNDQLVIMRRAIALDGGLRITASICNQDGGGTKAGADGRPAGAVAGTVELPAQITSDLLELVTDADKIVEQCRAMQTRLLSGS
jgi:hypothetical protein